MVEAMLFGIKNPYFVGIGKTISSSGLKQIQFGVSTDIAVPGDYDGDGKDDVAVYRPSTGTWYMNNSTTGFAAQQFDISTDIPIPAVYHP